MKKKIKPQAKPVTIKRRFMETLPDERFFRWITVYSDFKITVGGPQEMKQNQLIEVVPT